MNDISEKYALLVDGDNISGSFVKDIMDIASTCGVITYRRIYGNWTTNQMSSWKKVLLDYAFTPMQQFAYTAGKNATDSALIIDAMDILYSGNVQGFIIVSSDSDFTKLAQRLKESGMKVVGIGKKQTPQAFKSACTRFVFLDEKEETTDDAAENKDQSKKESKGTDVKQKKDVQNESNITSLNEIKAAIDRILEEFHDDEGYVIASTINDILRNRYPDFSHKNYNYKTFSKMLEKMGYKLEDKNSNKYVKYKT